MILGSKYNPYNKKFGGKEKKEKKRKEWVGNHNLVQTKMAIIVKDTHTNTRKEQGPQEEKNEG